MPSESCDPLESSKGSWKSLGSSGGEVLLSLKEAALGQVHTQVLSHTWRCIYKMSGKVSGRQHPQLSMEKLNAFYKVA